MHNKADTGMALGRTLRRTRSGAISGLQGGRVGALRRVSPQPIRGVLLLVQFVFISLPAKEQHRQRECQGGRAEREARFG